MRSLALCSFVEWVERSETHHGLLQKVLGSTALYPFLRAGSSERSVGISMAMFARRVLQSMLDHLAAHLPLEARKKLAYAKARVTPARCIA